MQSHPVGLVVLALTLSACAPGLPGTWFGRLACGSLRFDTRLDLAAEGADVVAGTGEQTREFEDAQRNGWITEEIIRFDVRLGLPEDAEDTTLSTRLTCTSEEAIEYKTNRSEPTSFDMDCEPDRFEDYVITWDRADSLQMSGPDTCVGTLARTSD